MNTFTDFFHTHKHEFDAILFDVDGTLASGKTPLPGAKELLEELNSIDFPYLLLTNDACNSPAQKAGYLAAGGLPITEKRILSAGNALKWWVQNSGYSGELFFQYGKLGNPSFVEAAGINFTTDCSRIDECHGVLCGEGYYDWQPAIEAAFNLLLKHPEYPMLCANPDSYWPSLKINGMGIGCGAMARFICQVLKDTGRDVSPIYLGKPYSPIYKYVFPFLQGLFPEKKFDDPKRIIMVGDSLKSDIAGANANGIASALLLSGVTDENLLAAAEAAERPDFVFSSL